MEERLGSRCGKSRLEANVRVQPIDPTFASFYERDFIFLRTDLPGRFWETKWGGKWVSLQYRAHCFSIYHFYLADCLHLLNQPAVFYECVTHILFSSFAFLPSFAALCMSHFGAETGNIVEALLGVPLLPALLASKAKLLVLVFSLGTAAVRVTVKFGLFVENATNVKQ